MKAFLFSPYFPDNFGGGEKYLLDVARVLAQSKSCQVEVAIASEEDLSQGELGKIKKKYAQFFNFDLSNLAFVNTPLGSKGNLLKKTLWTKKYDLGFYLTDGSLFYSMAKKNILHIQVPLKLDKSGYFNKLKLKSWHKITTNSEFTKSIVEPSWGIQVDEAHQPLVDIEPLLKSVNLQQKEKIILNVGRFFPQLHSKRQDILVTIFTRLIKKHPRELRGWRLVLVGGAENLEYAQRVAQLAEGLPIEIIHGANYEQVCDWYRRASIYWHATGYRVNEEDEPEKVEHFGISTVEAMAAGCVPVVIAKGGQREILTDELARWSWLTQRDCMKKTKQLIRQPKIRLEAQKAAQEKSRQFGPKLFQQKLANLIRNDN